MGEINLHIAVKEENSHLFKRCIRKLLESTFILRDKDERFYQFVSRESNRQDISEYLRMMGFDLILDDKVGVCMLVASEEDADVVGLKRANVVTFTALQYHLLLVLWKVYLENLGYSEGNYVTKGDLIDKIKSAQNRTQFGLYRGEKTKKEIQRFRQAERRTERSSDSVWRHPGAAGS